MELKNISVLLYNKYVIWCIIFNLNNFFIVFNKCFKNWIEYETDEISDLSFN